MIVLKGWQVTLLRWTLRLYLIYYLASKSVLPSLNGIGTSMDGLLQPRLNLSTQKQQEPVDILD